MAVNVRSCRFLLYSLFLSRFMHILHLVYPDNIYNICIIYLAAVMIHPSSDDHCNGSNAIFEKIPLTSVQPSDFAKAAIRRGREKGSKFADTPL